MNYTKRDNSSKFINSSQRKKSNRKIKWKGGLPLPKKQKNTFKSGKLKESEPMNTTIPMDTITSTTMETINDNNIDGVNELKNHLSDITPDNLNSINTEKIGNQVANFGNNLSSMATLNINNYIIKFNDMVEKYIKPVDAELLGSSIKVVMMKSNVLLKEIRTELEVIFKELIQLYANLIDDTNPIIKKLLGSFIDNITGVFTIFITKMVQIMSMTIQDIIKAIPVVGEVFDIIQLFSRSSLCFFQILSQIICTYRDLVDIIQLLTRGTKENIENWRKIKNAFLSILFKIGNQFRNIVPNFSKQKPSALVAPVEDEIPQ